MKILWLYLLAVGAPLYIQLERDAILASGLNIPPLWFQLLPLTIMVLGEALIGRRSS